jgi:signal peptidase II
MLPYILILLAFLADRLSKWWAISFLAENGPTQINPYFFVRETYNRGIAFGLFQGLGPIVGWLSIAVVIGMVVYLSRIPRQERIMRVGLALAIGGALGNLVDRVSAGQVLDFIQTPFRTGIFNVADVMIQLGIGLVLLATIWSGFRSRGQAEGKTSPVSKEGHLD